MVLLVFQVLQVFDHSSHAVLWQVGPKNTEPIHFHLPTDRHDLGTQIRDGIAQTDNFRLRVPLGPFEMGRAILRSLACSACDCLWYYGLSLARPMLAKQHDFAQQTGAPWTQALLEQPRVPAHPIRCPHLRAAVPKVLDMVRLLASTLWTSLLRMAAMDRMRCCVRGSIRRSVLKEESNSLSPFPVRGREYAGEDQRMR